MRLVRRHKRPEPGLENTECDTPHEEYRALTKALQNGPIDKRLSHVPFTDESRVRFPLGLQVGIAQ